MNQRTMVKISAEESSISLQTVSRAYRSPQRFIILRSKLEELEEKKRIIVSDIHSFAVLRLCQRPDGMDVIEIDFAWLSVAGSGRLSGQSESLCLPYEYFLACIEESFQLGGQSRKLLSISENNRPHIEFQSRHHLKEVVKRKRLRRLLGKFLDKHFNWQNSRSIFITDDYEPYSFFFAEKTAHGKGICGGIILHGREDLQKAYYGIHT